MKTIKILVLILLLTEAGFGTIRYVSKTGSSTPPYITWETASDSIQKCLNICIDGDTVIVANGVYKEAIVINRELTLLGSSMDSCIIDGTGLSNYFMVYTDAKTYIAGFKIKGKGVGQSSAGLYAENAPCKISNVKIENGSNGIGSWNSEFFANNLFFINIKTIAVLTSSPTTLVTIDNCVLINNLSEKYAMYCVPHLG